MKTNIQYKILLLVPMFFVGCNDHKNRIEGKSGNKFLLRDIETGIERIYEYDTTDTYKQDRYPYYYVGDTICVNAPKYKICRVITDKNTGLYGVSDHKVEQRKFNKLKQQHFSKQRK